MSFHTGLFAGTSSFECGQNSLRERGRLEQQQNARQSLLESQVSQYVLGLQNKLDRPQLQQRPGHENQQPSRGMKAHYHFATLRQPIMPRLATVSQPLRSRKAYARQIQPTASVQLSILMSQSPAANSRGYRSALMHNSHHTPQPNVGYTDVIEDAFEYSDNMDEVRDTDNLLHYLVSPARSQRVETAVEHPPRRHNLIYEPQDQDYLMEHPRTLKRHSGPNQREHHQPHDMCPADPERYLAENVIQKAYEEESHNPAQNLRAAIQDALEAHFPQEHEIAHAALEKYSAHHEDAWDTYAQHIAHRHDVRNDYADHRASRKIKTSASAMRPRTDNRKSHIKADDNPVETVQQLLERLLIESQIAKQDSSSLPDPLLGDESAQNLIDRLFANGQTTKKPSLDHSVDRPDYPLKQQNWASGSQNCRHTASRVEHRPVADSSAGTTATASASSPSVIEKENSNADTEVGKPLNELLTRAFENAIAEQLSDKDVGASKQSCELPGSHIRATSATNSDQSSHLMKDIIENVIQNAGVSSKSSGDGAKNVGRPSEPMDQGTATENTIPANAADTVSQHKVPHQSINGKQPMRQAQKLEETQASIKSLHQTETTQLKLKKLQEIETVLDSTAPALLYRAKIGASEPTSSSSAASESTKARTMLEEALMDSVLKLDQVETDGIEAVRLERKRIIRKVEELLDFVDELKQKANQSGPKTSDSSLTEVHEEPTIVDGLGELATEDSIVQEDDTTQPATTSEKLPKIQESDIPIIEDEPSDLKSPRSAGNSVQSATPHTTANNVIAADEFDTCSTSSRSSQIYPKDHVEDPDEDDILVDATKVDDERHNSIAVDSPDSPLLVPNEEYLKAKEEEAGPIVEQNPETLPERELEVQVSEEVEPEDNVNIATPIAVESAPSMCVSATRAEAPVTEDLSTSGPSSPNSESDSWDLLREIPSFLDHSAAAMANVTQQPTESLSTSSDMSDFSTNKDDAASPEISNKQDVQADQQDQSQPPAPAITDMPVMDKAEIGNDGAHPAANTHNIDTEDNSQGKSKSSSSASSEIPASGKSVSGSDASNLPASDVIDTEGEFMEVDGEQILGKKMKRCNSKGKAKGKKKTHRKK